MARTTRNTRSWIIPSAVIIFICFGLFAYQPVFTSRGTAFLSQQPVDDFQASKQNVWSDLTKDEVDDLLHFLYHGKNDLNLTKVANSSPWDNHLAGIETLIPNKTDTLPFLDIDSDAPSRWARITVSEGASEQAALVDYMVGPLPTGEDTQILPLMYLYNSGRNYVKNPLPAFEDIIEWFSSLGEEIPDMIKDLLGEVVNPGHVKGAPPLMAVSRPAAYNDGTVSQWASIHGPGVRYDAWSIMPQGMYCRFDISGRDASQWKMHEWFYNGVLYNSTEAFRSAWKAGKVEKLPLNIDGTWTAAEPSAHGLPEREGTPPIMVQPEGNRYKIDTKERFVSWMGFEFYFTTLQATAMTLWDIKFKGERIMYELGLQEAMAHYAGNDPMTIGMVWLDTLFGMGFNMYQLVPGHDCPAYATYLPTMFHQGDSTIYRNNSICIFEYTADHPLQRHTTATHVSVSRNTYLIVRSVSTVGNYDYTIDYIFYLDGTVEVKVRASGYIFGAYHQLEAARQQASAASYSNANDEGRPTELLSSRNSDEESSESEGEPLIYEYGYLVHPNLATSMHDHAIAFKADLDIISPTNSFHKVDVAPITRKYQWDSVPRKTMHLRQTPFTTETGLEWPKNAGAMFVVLNNATENAWGEKRGYRIAPGTGMGNPPHLTIKDSPALGKAAGWAESNLFVLKNRDTERRAASEFNAMEPEEPLVDFSKYVDGEGIVDEDLVLYFTLGSHHIPHSGDIPNTLMHTSASSVMFIPHNFHDSDPSRFSAGGVKLDMKQDADGCKVTHYGGEYVHGVEVEKKDLEPDLRYYSAPEFSQWDLSWNATLAAL
ncbi:copper amine oxidase [Aulographum hederae CBS 113979]|uniref:Amine oxidase n=1 Tax=Aulographum hederae CBS 113979 TaxID=1176131 RepID=A0A6G1H084_9PEZI|nr:copper amine oxidase [Aulographum hederae CBS 113979]